MGRAGGRWVDVYSKNNHQIRLLIVIVRVGIYRLKPAVFKDNSVNSEITVGFRVNVTMETTALCFG